MMTLKTGIMSFTDADLLKNPGFIGDYARFGRLRLDCLRRFRLWLIGSLNQVKQIGFGPLGFFGMIGFWDSSALCFDLESDCILDCLSRCVIIPNFFIF